MRVDIADLAKVTPDACMNLDQLFLLVMIGFGVGVFGTLVGAGGGFILVPVLLLLYPDATPRAITTVSLGVVFFNALSGSLAYARMRRIDYWTGLRFATATLPGAIVGVFVVSHVQRVLFGAIFGLLLVVISGYLLLRPSASRLRWFKPDTTRTLVDGTGHRYEYGYHLRSGLSLSFGVGFLSSFFGIGGGIIHVPALIELFNFPTHVATATSHFILAIMAGTGSATHFTQGDFSGNVGPRTIVLSGGVVVGAQIGAILSQRIHATWIQRLLALGLGSLGIRLLLGTIVH